MDNLAVIMPVYNEEEIIEEVVKSWICILDKISVEYKIFAYNDGSKDKSGEILEKLAKNEPNLIVINKKNSGHGDTVMQGYTENALSYKWLFQTDSDNEMSPEGFLSLWNKREDYDFLIGKRLGRKQPLTREFISFISRLSVRIFYGKGPWDVNSPYRLMRSEKFIDIFKKIPKGTFAPNIIISAIVGKNKIKFYETPVPCQGRKTGVPSAQNFRMFKVAVKSFLQTIFFSFKKV